MIFMLHGILALQLLALTGGVTLLIWSLRSEGAGMRLAKFFGFLITVLASISVLCSLYFTFVFWKDTSHLERYMQMQESSDTATSSDEN